jgi:hypothetical protein
MAGTLEFLVKGVFPTVTDNDPACGSYEATRFEHAA